MASPVPQKKIVVVGAGIAGLTAAYYLQKQGYSVTVFESGSRVGGRMASDVVDAHTVDRGAQYISSKGQTLLRLIDELALNTSFEETTQSNMLQRNGVLEKIRSDCLLPPFFSKVLKTKDWLRLRTFMRQEGPHLAEYPIDDYSLWGDFDTESIQEWCSRDLSQEVIDYYFEPLLSTLQFQTVDNTSKALALWYVNLVSQRSKLLSAKEGLGVLPAALAAGLPVVLNTPVRRIHRHNNVVNLIAGDEMHQADAVVIAVPAGRARQIYNPDNEFERRALAVPYASALNVFLLLHNGYELPRKLKQICSILLPSRERRDIALIGIARNKYPSRAGLTDQTLLNIVPGPVATERLLGYSDKAILAELMPELERYLPKASTYFAGGRIFRWQAAVPKSFVGRTSNIAAYRRFLGSRRTNVVLAGDYLGLPNTEGAAQSGVWAANYLAGIGRS